MPLSHVDHFLIQTSDLEKTKNWYVDILGLTVGPHPDFKFPVYWLYLGNHPVVHITEGGTNVSANRMRYLGQQSQAQSGSGVVDHIAFFAHEPKAIMAHLDQHNVDYNTRQVDDQGLFQIFMMDPNGIKIELSFPANEARDIDASLMATSLT